MSYSCVAFLVMCCLYHYLIANHWHRTHVEHKCTAHESTHWWISLIQNMKKKHQTQFDKFQHDQNAKQQKPKFSTELLNYRKIEEHLVKSKEYGEAHKTKEKADELEAFEIEKYKRQRQKDMNRLEHQFKQSKRQELGALEKRLQTGREEQKKQRQFALER